MKASRTRPAPTPSTQRRSGEQLRTGDRRKSEAIGHAVVDLLEGDPEPGLASDNTRDRIRALLRSMRTVRGVADVEARDDYQEGRALVEALADSAEGTKPPSLRLSPEQCATICDYLTWIEPLNGATWWNDAPTSHICGLHAIYAAMAQSLRGTEASEHELPESPARPATWLTTLNPLDEFIGDVIMVQNVIGCVIATMDAEADFKEPWAEQVRCTLRLVESRFESLAEEGMDIHTDLSKLIA